MVKCLCGISLPNRKIELDRQPVQTPIPTSNTVIPLFFPILKSIIFIIYDKLANYYMLYTAKTNISINFLEHYEIKKYEEGDFFENHRDNYFALDSKQDRKVNLICQLSDEHSYNGGEFKLGSFTFTKKQGSILLFPATYMHEVTKVTSGTRYSLIGHAWGPNWI